MSFQSLNLPDYLLEALDALSYTQPTKIQEEGIPIVLEGQDLMGEAQTGTGKTAAFALPTIKMLQELPQKKKKTSVLALVLVPTRELALQVSKAFKSYAKYTPRETKVISLIGGEPIEIQIRGLRMGVDIAIATPGRLLDLIEREEIRLYELEILLLDEADKMLDLGFSEELEQVFSKIPEKRQNLLFTATMPEKVEALSESILKDPTVIRIEQDQSSANIEQRAIEVNEDKKRSLLQHLIKSENWEQTLIFVASKRSARNLAGKLSKNGIKASDFHGDLNQGERSNILNKFKDRKLNILIATDLAARGIDILELSCVINYDLPRSAKDYTHRIGRTGRAGASGVAVSFITYETQDHFKLIEERTNNSINREQIPGFEMTGEAPVQVKGEAPKKGKRKSKKDRLREQKSKGKPSFPYKKMGDDL